MLNLLEDTREEGKKEGKAIMYANISALYTAMQKDGRVEEFDAALSNINTVRALFREYGITEKEEAAS